MRPSSWESIGSEEPKGRSGPLEALEVVLDMVLVLDTLELPLTAYWARTHR